MKVKTININTSKLRSGLYGKNRTGKGEVRLLNKEGYSDITGLVLLQLGFTKNQLKDKRNPGIIQQNIFKESGDLNRLGEKAIDINDDEDTTLKDKQRKWKTLFYNYGIKLTFNSSRSTT